MRQFLIYLCALVWTATAAPGVAGQLFAAFPVTGSATDPLQRYHDDKGQFSVELPAEWVAVDRESLRARPLTRLKIPHEMAFRPSDKSGRLTGYVLVETLPRDPARSGSYAELEAHLLEGLEVADPDATGELDRIILRLPYGQAGVDSSRQRIILRQIFETPAVRGVTSKVVVISALYIGKEKTIGLHCCATPDSFARQLKLFTHLIDSFEFDPQVSFVEQPVPVAEQEATFSFKSPQLPSQQVVVLVLLGVLTLLSCLIGGMIMLRPGRRRKNEHDPHVVNIRQGSSTSAAANLLKITEAPGKDP
jgi:hypothetical protein